MLANDTVTRDYWTREVADLQATLATGLSGLSEEDAGQRLQRVGENRITERDELGAVKLLLRQFASPLVLILIFGATIALLVKEWTDATIILSIVLGSALLGFSQEYRASDAIKRLRDRLALKAVVLRDGEPRTVDARCIVPGDVLLLSAGNLVPADGVVIEGRDFLVAEAALTGESFPVEKQPGPVPRDAPLSKRLNCVFVGTSVRSGTARVLAVRTGRATELASIASRIGSTAEQSDFERGIRDFGYLLTRIMMVMVVFVFTVNLLLQRPLIDSLLFAVALAVGLTPELLPAIVSVTLSAGARRMAKRGVIVRRLEAIENLGGVDVLCTDKTGTLTQGVIALSSAVDAHGEASARVLDYAILNSCLETGIDNPLDAAILAEAERLSLPRSAASKIDEIPFDFVRKRLTVVVRDEARDDRHVIITKGAFDGVLSCCDRVAARGGTKPLDADMISSLKAYFSARGSEGFRVVALATKLVEPKPGYGRADESGMVFEGFLAFFDPLKDGIGETLKELAELGVATKIVTGDNRHIAAHVGAAIGLDAARLMTGEQLSQMREEALWHLAEVTDIFAETDPQQKERIVRALQQRGHSVAYLGDGINDAPALNAADVGVSVDQAVDVARESADVVLLERDLDVLRDGVIDGRRTFANTLKYVSITTSANFGNMISMALATLFVPFLPLLAKQILLNNFLSDLPSIAIATDNVDAHATATAQRWSIRDVQSFMIVFGLISTVFDLITFVVLLEVFNAPELLFQTTWFVVSVLTELVVLLVLRTRLPSWQSRPGTLLLVSTCAIAAVAVLLPYVGGLARPLGFVPLSASMLLTSFLVVALYVVTTELAKSWYFRSGRRA